MKPITAGDPQSQSADIVAENVAKLRALFPEAFPEGAIDFAVLQQLLGGAVPEKEEKYGLNWHGKRAARQLALTPSMGTLRPAPADSVDWDTTRNIMIEGDNLEVLKMLQKSYSGKVKLIYIDPPYNTGNDFVYSDDFRDNIGNYKRIVGHIDGNGHQLTTNSESSGRFHTKWLNMMLPRLKLARNLLREDGAIFVNIDDREVSNLRKLLDEVFGEENFVANVIWQKKFAVSADDPGIAAMHDHILVYQKTEIFDRGLLPRTEAQTSRYTNLDNDPRGDWASDNYVSNKSKDERPTLWYPIIHPRTKKDVWPEEHAVWRYSKERHAIMEAENRLYWGPNQSYEKPRLKRFLNEVQDGIVPPTWWTFQDCGHNDEAQKEVAELVGPKVFTTPKPIRLLDRVLKIGAGKADLILDFFAGSGTTAHAVIAQNAVDGGSRRFILVQLDQPLDPEKTEHKVPAEFCKKLGKPLNIAELTKERLRRAGKKVKADNPTFAGDIGFRVYKLDSSNIRPWDPKSDNLEGTVFDSVEHIKDGRTPDDILTELLLKLGLDLSVPIETKTIAKKKVHSIGGGVLLVCLDTPIATKQVEELAIGIVEWHKALAPAGDSQAVFRDSAFEDDIAKTNLTAILAQHGLANVRSL